jgi:RNA polymerase sigma factor (sigma-70 family)
MSSNRRLIKAYLAEIGDIPLLSSEDEIALIREIRAGGIGAQKARERFVCSNLLLVFSIAAKFFSVYCNKCTKRGMSLLDLVQEGYFGLEQAVDGFELSRQCRFSTYAFWKILRKIQRAVCLRRKDAVRIKYMSDLPCRSVGKTWIERNIGRAREEIFASFPTLTEKQRIAALHIFGFVDLGGRSLDELAKSIGSTRSGLYNLAKRAVEGLRRSGILKDLIFDMP